MDADDSKVRELLWQAYIANQAYDLILHGGTVEYGGERFQVDGLSYYHERMEKHVAALEDAATVADLGAGTGNLALRLAKQGKHVFAVENNPFMVSEMERKIKGVAEEIDDAGGSIGSLAQDANHVKLPYCVDGISSNNVLYLSTIDPSRFLRGAYRWLKDGGVFVVSSFCENPDMDAIFRQGFIEGGQRKVTLKDGRDITHVELLKPQADIVVQANKVLFRNGLMKNLYSLDTIEKALSFAGFDVESVRKDYVGQGFTAVARKVER